MTNARKCIFCGGPRDSREHIWADWLEPYLPREMQSHTLYSAVITKPGEETATRKKRSGDPHSTQVQCVCKRCNGGWMSKLQEAVKPVLLPLINGKHCTLEPRWQQSTLAGWAAMSVMAAECIADRIAIPQIDREYLKGHRRPPQQGWRIWIGNFKRGDWPGYWAHNLFSFTEEELAKGTYRASEKPNTQTTAYVVGQLFVYVFSSAIPEVVTLWRFDGRADTLLRRVWPPNDLDIGWPPSETMLDRDADSIAAAFGRFFDFVSSQDD